MEMIPNILVTRLRKQFLCLVMLLLAGGLQAQPTLNAVSVKKGQIYISLGKEQTPASLDSFITQYQLEELDLKTFLKNNRPDSLIKMGFKIILNNAEMLVIGKSMEPADNLADPAEVIIFTQDHFGNADSYPNKNPLYGINKFVKKHPFKVMDSSVTFFLRGFDKSKTVMLAGSFNNWNPDKLSMTRVDSGWITTIYLGPGKHYYKFIADGKWMVDKDNELVENDGMGNDNSVYYKTNYVFTLAGYNKARRVNIAGSFDNWNSEEIKMSRNEQGWFRDIYLAPGTHIYRFVVDGNWFADPANPKSVPNEFGQTNSVVTMGQPFVFVLKGHSAATKVILMGNFNQWRDFELPMQRTDSGWVYAYVLDKGNYEYNFLVDGKKPKDSLTGKDLSNQKLVLGANHRFNLKGYPNAKQVYVAGTFNNWSPTGFAMTKSAEGWELSQYLSPGKHAYKFVVDGNWIVDTANELREPNEFNQENSVIWMK
jgi:hypothetical protein